jgi:hypothetical protein
MILEVRRKFISVDTRSVWEQQDYDALVWCYHVEAKLLTVHQQAAPEGYVPGLMFCVIDGRRVHTREFDIMLKGLELSRAEIEKAVK